VQEWPKTQPKPFYSDGIWKLVDHWKAHTEKYCNYIQKYVQLQCDYFIKTENKITFNFLLLYLYEYLQNISVNTEAIQIIFYLQKKNTIKI